MQWFEVDKAGLSAVLARKGKAFCVYELIQNALDEATTQVDVSIERIEGTKHVWLSVKDNAPGGFQNLELAWVLFGPSSKRAEAEKRGRFAVGEKLVLALCSEASITTTTGQVTFDDQGRRRGRRCTTVGSEFRGRIRMTSEEVQECEEAVRRVLVPPGVTLTFNGEVMVSTVPVARFQATLQTEVADSEGNLRRSSRSTQVELHDPRGGPAWLYEMGIPVVEIAGDKWHVNVMQKVPLALDRENVTAAYLAKIRTLVVQHAWESMTVEDANSSWVRDAIGRYGHELEDRAIKRLMDLRFGERRVSHDPGDPEASKRATAEGYVVVHGSQLSGTEWDLAKRAKAIEPASAVTPSPKPYGDGPAREMLARERWTEAMKHVAAYMELVGSRLTGRVVSVEVASDITWPFRATYGGGKLTLNLGRLGHGWFEGCLEDINDLLLHEVAHEVEGDHLSENYYRALTRMGAKLTSLALAEPHLFKVPGGKGPSAGSVLRSSAGLVAGDAVRVQTSDRGTRSAH